MRQKRRFTFIASLICALMLTSCGDGISQEEHAALSAERDALRAQVQELQETASAEPRKQLVRISGQFSAMVRELLPDYIVDDFTPSVAVLTEFQSAPFSLILGARAGDLTPGKVYVFEIEPKEVEIPANTDCQFGPDLALWLYGLKITSIRPADTESDDEWGLQPKGLAYEIIG